jgi:hypothetical protein
LREIGRDNLKELLGQSLTRCWLPGRWSGLVGAGVRSEEWLEGDKVARQTGIGSWIAVRQDCDDLRTMGSQIADYNPDHRLPKPVACVQQTTGRNRCGGF